MKQGYKVYRFLVVELHILAHHLHIKLNSYSTQLQVCTDMDFEVTEHQTEKQSKLYRPRQFRWFKIPRGKCGPNISFNEKVKYNHHFNSKVPLNCFIIELSEQFIVTTL